MRHPLVGLFSDESFADRLVFTFVLWSALWIVVSDYLLSLLPIPVAGYWRLEMLKGLVYVAVSGMLWWVAIVAIERNEAAQRVINERRLKILKDSGLVAVAFWNANGAITATNDAFNKMLGYKKDELQAYNVASLLVASPTISSIHRELLDAGRSGLHELELLRKDGAHVPVYGGSAIVTEDGERVAYFVNISKLKSNEEERARLYERLVNSEKVNALGQLAGGIAHNFNNELAIVVGYCSLVRAQAGADAFTVKSMDAVLKAAERSRQMIQDLLTYGRGRSMNYKVVDLSRLIIEMGPTMRQLLPENIELKLLPSKEPECAEIDPGQLEQVLMNLVTNARDAMPRGGRLEIEVSHARSDKPAEQDASRGTVILRVSDTGMGMDALTAQRIFEPFFTTKRGTGGTGLGLASVFGIVKQNGGEISVASEPRKGSTFTVTFPKAQYRTVLEKVSTGDNSPQEIRGNVLLVEDMDALREMLTQILTNHGLRVFPARDGREAVEIARDKKMNLDLVVTDVVMPRMNGPEAVQEIRQIWPKVKVIYVSGHADLIDPDCKDEVLWKPVRPEKLVSSIYENLSPPGSRRPAA